VNVSVTENIGGMNHTAVYWTLPDYIAVGSDADFFRIPTTPMLAQRLANLLGCSMITRKMSDDIWTASDLKLNPHPFSPGTYDIQAVSTWWLSQQAIEDERTGNPLGLLVSGIKKDVVLTPLIATTPNKVFIYGWHYPTGSPIQPLYGGHVDWYHDYSHGTRLVLQQMTVDGNPTTVSATLQHATLNALLSDEGPIATPSFPTSGSPPETFTYEDSFPSTGRELTSWKNKFTTPTIQSLSPSSPGGDGYVLNVRDPSGGTDTTRIGQVTDGDVYVKADIYCEYRPGLVADGFERVGIFARDSGVAAFDGTLSQAGECYLLAWDSGTGRLWCARATGGVVTDLNPSPVFMASTAWRTFRIEAEGSSLRFLVNGSPVLSTTDATHDRGQGGIGFHEYFTTNGNMLGTRADNFESGLISNPVPSGLTLLSAP
jgi:hypothetical protein